MDTLLHEHEPDKAPPVGLDYRPNVGALLKRPERRDVLIAALFGVIALAALIALAHTLLFGMDDSPRTGVAVYRVSDPEPYPHSTVQIFLAVGTSGVVAVLFGILCVGRVLQIRARRERYVTRWVLPPQRKTLPDFLRQSHDAGERR